MSINSLFIILIVLFVISLIVFAIAGKDVLCALGLGEIICMFIMVIMSGCLIEFIIRSGIDIINMVIG